MLIEDAMLAERAQYANIIFPKMMVVNLIGGVTTAWVFSSVVPFYYLVILVSIFVLQEAHAIHTSQNYRRVEYTAQRAHNLFRYLCIQGCIASATWSTAMYFYFPHGALIQQFAFMCAVVILGLSTAVGFATYIPAFLCTFLPFSLSAFCIIAIQKTVFYSAMLSIAMFAPMVIMAAIYVNHLLIGSLRLRFQNIELVEALTVQKDIAESAVLAKSRFLAAASHDLRQPVHALGLFIAALQTIIKRPELDREEIAHIAIQQKSALSGLGRLLNGVLDVSRFDSGAVEVNRQVFSLNHELEVLRNSFSGPALDKGIALRIRCPHEVWVYADTTLLHQILSNLIANAVRYTDFGGILVACRLRGDKQGENRGDKVEIQVWDTGIGVAADQLDKIFDEFYQVGNSARNHEMGLGLGLAIVRRSAHLLGARLDVKSVFGKGSRFSITVPLATASGSPLEDKSALPVGQPRRSKTVLVVDDEPAVREAISVLLSAWGHIVISAATQEQALQAADTHFEVIDVILADYQLGDEVNGADVIRSVISVLHRQVPAAIITGDTSPDGIREASASGFKLLHKPLDPQLLEDLLQDC